MLHTIILYIFEYKYLLSNICNVMSKLKLIKKKLTITRFKTKHLNVIKQIPDLKTEYNFCCFSFNDNVSLCLHKPF